VTWLLKLYPRIWRQRYGDEVAQLLAGRGFSLAVAVDLVAGAIDVRLHPSATLAAATAASREEEQTMFDRIAKLDCAAMFGAEITKADQLKAAGVTIGLTVVLTLIWMWVHVRLGDNAYADSLSVMPFIVPFLYSMRYTYLKRRSAGAQAVFIGGMSLIVAGLMLGAGWLSTLM
jgi:hypothetical protein